MINNKKIENSVSGLPLMIDERALAGLLAVSVSKIRKDRLKGKGVMPCRIGRAVRYRRDTVLAYVNSLVDGGHNA